MAAGIRASDADVLCFVDSDSTLAPNALQEIVRPFADPRVAIVTGHADVLNRGENLLTRLQQVRYYVAFRVVKAAESVFGAVSCASGCFSAYRREPLLEVLEDWEHQRFLGREATFGDDRALTNALLRNWRVVYQSTATCETIVPATMRRFLVQQVRWKKSWTRESIAAARFFWRKHPAAAASQYSSILFQLVGPLIAFRALDLGAADERGLAADVPRRPLHDGPDLQPLLRLAAALAVLVGRHRLRRALRGRADLADVLGDPVLAPHAVGHPGRPRGRRRRAAHHRPHRPARQQRHPRLATTSRSCGPRCRRRPSPCTTRPFGDERINWPERIALGPAADAPRPAAPSAA